MILTQLEREEIDASSLITNALHGRNQDSFDTVARIRQTPSGESAGRENARTAQRFQHHPVFINEQAASGPHTGLHAYGAIGKDQGVPSFPAQ